MNIYWKTACAVGLMTVGFLGGWYVNGNRLGKQIAEIQQAHTEEQAKAEKAVQAKEQSYQQAMQKQAEDYQTTVSKMETVYDKLQLELKNVQKKNPMSDTCKLDADRLSVIAKARNSANGTGAGSR